MQVEFLGLRYIENPLAITGPSIGVAYRRISEDPWEIRCKFKHGWAALIKGRDRLSWGEGVLGELDGPDAGRSFHQWEALRTSSIGLLRAERPGICDESEISNLLSA